MTEDIHDIAKRQHHLLREIYDLIDHDSNQQLRNKEYLKVSFPYYGKMQREIRYLLNQYDENHNYEGKEND